MLLISPHGGRLFHRWKPFCYFFSMWWQFCYVFLRMGFFSQFKGLFCSFFFHVEPFLLRLSPYGGLFSPFKSLSATFFSILGLFATFFFLMGAFFHYLKTLLLRFSPFGGLFWPFKGLSATFFLYVEAFLLRFSCGGASFHLLKAFLLLFFSIWGRCFCFYGDFFSFPPPLPKCRRGLMPACPLTPMSNMQHSHSLTASCHFRNVLKIVTNYFLIYIFAWLTIFLKSEKGTRTTFSNSKYCFLSIYGIYFYRKPMKSEYFDFLLRWNENTYINLV